MRFDDDLALTPTEGGFSLDVSDGWGIYGNPNGGFLAALMAEGLDRVLPHDDPCTVTCHYLRPTTPGPASMAVERLRAGRSTSTARGLLSVGGKPTVHAVGTFGDVGGLSGPTCLEGKMPDLPPPDMCDPREGGPGPGTGSTFGERLDLRYAPGTIPFVEGRRAPPMELGGWVRFRDGRDPDVKSLLLFADAMPPPVLRVVERVWVPTLELTVHVRARPRPGWIAAWFRTRYLVDGTLEEDGELFDEAGTLVAQSRQLARVMPT